MQSKRDQQVTYQAAHASVFSRLAAQSTASKASSHSEDKVAVPRSDAGGWAFGAPRPRNMTPARRADAYSQWDAHQGRPQSMSNGFRNYSENARGRQENIWKTDDGAWEPLSANIEQTERSAHHQQPLGLANSPARDFVDRRGYGRGRGRNRRRGNNRQNWEIQNWVNQGAEKYNPSDKLSAGSRLGIDSIFPEEESSGAIDPSSAIRSQPVGLAIAHGGDQEMAAAVAADSGWSHAHHVTHADNDIAVSHTRFLTVDDVKAMHRAQGTAPNVPNILLEDWLKARQAEAEAEAEGRAQAAIDAKAQAQAQAKRPDDARSESSSTTPRASQVWSQSEENLTARTEARPDSRIGIAIQPTILQSTAGVGAPIQALLRKTMPDHSEFIIRNRDEYEVPALGSEEMPALRLRKLPDYKTIWEQANETLPPEIRDIPAPIYAFSKKKDVKIDPATIGAVPDPEPQNLDPLPNPLDMTYEQGIQHKVEKMGCASSESNFGFSEDVFVVVGETVEAASRWKWFVDPELPIVGDVEGRHLDFQLCEFDPVINFEEGGSRAGYLWAVHESARNSIDRWVDTVSVNHIKCPIVVDVDEEEWQAGRLPTSGVRYNYQEFPPDLGYRPVRLFYGVIDWDSIPQPKLSQPEYENTSRLNQSSHMIIRLETQRLAKRLIEVRKRDGRKQAEMREFKKAFPPLKNTDTATALTQNNPWSPKLKVRMRVAKNSDVHGIWHIFNHYARRTIHLPEQSGIDLEEMKNRIQVVRNEKYPFLVAVLHASPQENYSMPWIVRNKSHRKLRDRSIEYVVGFACARSWDGLGGCVDDACQFEVFVAPQFTNSGIGGNLLDRLVGCLDTDYQSHRGVAIEVEPHRAKWNRDWRRTHTHIFKLYYRDPNDAEFTGRKHFLLREFGFEEFGKLTDVCTKNGGRKRYSVCFLQRAANRCHGTYIPQ